MPFWKETLYVVFVLCLVGPTLRNYLNSFFVPFTGLVLGNYPPMEMQSVQVKVYGLERLDRKPLSGAASAGLLVSFIWAITVLLGFELTSRVQAILLAIIFFSYAMSILTLLAYRAVRRRMPRQTP